MLSLEKLTPSLTTVAVRNFGFSMNRKEISHQDNECCSSRSVSNGILAVDFGNFLNNSINESSDSRSVYLIFLPESQIAELKTMFSSVYFALS